MKKTYSIPTAKVMRAALTAQILSGSGAMSVGSDALGIDGSVPNGQNPSTAY